MAVFRYFVIFAEMRTGSNLLEASLNALDGVTSFGELFNPHFVGGPNRDAVFGITLEMREETPNDMIQAMLAQSEDIPGFRLFHDHDSRIIEEVIDDPECAKIILTRNPVDAFVSRKIAGATGQWKLGDAKDRKNARVIFELDEFDSYLAIRQSFQSALRNKLQVAGQTAFSVTYDDIQSVDVINGLAKFIGVEARLDDIPSSIKKQNPQPMSEKIENFADMQTALTGHDWLDLNAAPNFEPTRGPGVPGFIAAAHSNLLFLPIEGGPVRDISAWLAALDGAEPVKGFTQRSLMAWLNDKEDRLVFCVLRHPVARAYDAFLRKVVLEGPDQRKGLRRTLENRYGLDLPSSEHDVRGMGNAFIAFLKFLESNLSGQTSIGVDASWASQTATIEGFTKVIPADVIIRESDVAKTLASLCPGGPAYSVQEPLPAAPLQEVYNAKMETAARKTYRRDYQFLGFGPWA